MVSMNSCVNMNTVVLNFLKNLRCNENFFACENESKNNPKWLNLKTVMIALFGQNCFSEMKGFRILNYLRVYPLQCFQKKWKIYFNYLASWKFLF